MIRQIFWKEWHEHRSKYISYWATLYAPIVIFALAIALIKGARTPFADLSNALVLKYLPLSLAEGLFVLTIFLILTGYLAVATFSPEIEDRSLFFIYELGVLRRRYLTIKFLYGATHVVLAIFSAVLLLPAISYALMLISGRATVAGSGAAFAMVMHVAFRAGIWCALISLAVYTASALIAALIPRWWLASLCSVLVTLAFVGWGEDYFSFLPDMPNDSMSIGFSFSTDNSRWITISRALTPKELSQMAQWWTGPLIATLLLIGLFWAATTWLNDRRELR
jgi:hypothetical protein